MKYETVVMNNISTIESPASSDIMDFLSLITPEKRLWWGRAEHSLLTVDFKLPVNLQGFGLENDSDLFEDIDASLSAIKTHFCLEKVIVSGLKGYRGIFSGHFHHSSYNGIVLTASEALKLYESLKDDSFEDARYIHVLIDINSILSAFRVKVPGDSRVKGVYSFLTGRIGDGKHPEPGEGLFIFNPLSRKELNPEEIIGPESALIAITDEVKRLDAAGTGFLSLPSSRRKLSFRKVSDSLDTRRACCNCLACSIICPAGLSPNILFHFAESGEEDLDALGADLCFQCGLCTFICPSNIPLNIGIGGIHADES